MIPYGHQYIDEDDIKEVVSVLRSDFLTQGPKVKEFEESLVKNVNAKYAVAFSSGTAALEAAYFAVGFKEGDSAQGGPALGWEIITSPLTFAATSNAALHRGAKVVFADIEKETGNIDPLDVQKKITPKTKAIVPVDYSGLPVKLDELLNIAKQHNLLLIEDAAHALGAEYKGKKIGSIADMTMFSFHPVKSITTGEGGAITTNNEDFYKKLLLYRTHGITKENFKNNPEGPPAGGWYYEMQILAQNFRLTDIQAALGVSQLKKLEKFISARKTIAVKYNLAFAQNKNLILPKEYEGVSSSWHLYPIRLKNSSRRAEIFKKLRDSGIGAQVHYIPVHLHPYYQDLGYKKGICPNAEAFYAGEISLPIFPGLSPQDQDFVIEKVNQFTT